MRFGGIVLCRMDSRRLPGKALRRVSGRPLLWYVLSRCRLVPQLTDALIVATSDRPVDDPIAAYAESIGVPVFRGPVDDVAGRALACARRHGFDAFFRLNGDSPFVESALLAEAVAAFRREAVDLVTNLLPRSWPYGISVELVSTTAFERAMQLMCTDAQREHVTKVLYESIDQFRYVNLPFGGGDLSHVRMTVDTPEDWRRFEEFVARHAVDWPHFTTEHAIEYFGGVVHEHA